METEIYFLLHSLGIGAKYRGFRYLAYGIALCMEDEDYLLRVSKTLYPKIAQDRKSTRLNSSHTDSSRMPSSA